MVPIGDLRPSPRNPRTHSDAQIQQIVASVRQFGWTNPVLIDQELVIIAGEARWMAAKALALEQVPCIEIGHLTAAQRDAYRIADNRIPLNAGWNEQLLSQVLRDLEQMHFDLPALGFDDDELARLLEPPRLDADADAAVAPPAVPRTKPGDLWTLGRHRLFCGDSTKKETFGRLFSASLPAGVVVTDPPQPVLEEQPAEGDGADLVFTDPPYGMSYDGGMNGRFGMILNDDAKGEALVDLVASALQAAQPFVAKNSAWYVCFTWRTWREFAAAMARASLPVAACIVWDKGSTGLGFQHYRPQHEFVFYSPGRRWHGGRAESDVWQFTRGNTVGYVHPTQKPVALLERAIRNSSRIGDVVLDMFGGSGSTLMACERLERRARLVELDPRYCDAIVARWEQATGLKAVGGGDGE